MSSAEQIKSSLKETFTASGVLKLGNASPDIVSRWCVMLAGTFTGSMQPKGAVIRSGLTKQHVSYTDTADGTIKTAALTAVGAPILIEAAGMDIDLDVTITTGSMSIYAHPVAG